MSVFELTGRKALVTGGAQGLGEGMAQALAAAGATVVVADLQEELGHKVAEGLGEGHGFVALDVTSDEGWEKAIGEAAEHLGGLDILVNNAGIEITRSKVGKVLKTEIKSAVVLAVRDVFVVRGPVRRQVRHGRRLPARPARPARRRAGGPSGWCG